jgi:serine/threonine protein kinase/Tfp pilus assembly protein PilF
MKPLAGGNKAVPNAPEFGAAPVSGSSRETPGGGELKLDIHEHELLRRIGRGAYGEVWLARNALGAGRAIKIVFRKDFEDSRPFEREFEGIQKFEPISRSHPGFVNILQVGRHEDYFYYVMELADGVENPKPENLNPKFKAAADDGRTPRSKAGLPADFGKRTFDLDSYVPRTLREDLRQNGRLPAGRCIEIGLALTSALAHLHRHGLVHRDIKPSNIIFVEGSAKLADIGLVTEAGDSRSIVGTEGYLPPEGPGTPQADLFALGKVLYEATTGMDRRRFPDLPKELKEWPDAESALELNQIVLKACVVDVRERYAGAEEMRGDLARLAGGESVLLAHRFKRRRRLALRGAVWLAAIGAAVSLLALANQIWHPAIAPYVEKRSTNETANVFYDQGKNYFDQFTGTDFKRAVECFHSAIEADPRFGGAYGYLAAAYFWSSGDGWNPDFIYLTKAKEIAGQALALDKSLPEPHLALGWHHALKEWAWRDAETEYLRAIQLNRSSSFCHLCYGEFLRMAGRTSEALEEIKTAKALDSHSVIINIRRASYLVDARDYEGALTQVKLVRTMHPSRDIGWVESGALCALGRYEEAVEAERKSLVASGKSEDWLRQHADPLKSAVESGGANAYWSAKLEQAKTTHDLYTQACCWAQLGETNKAIAVLTTAAGQTNVLLTFHVATDWRLDPVRKDPHFRPILHTMHLD